ncbi:MAG: hypothetical protein QM662_15515 [Gordonia sp. (in: high G+C Gram-positive bacteria)]
MTTPRSPQTVTARSVLAAYLDLRWLESDVSRWGEEALADNPPRLIRFRRLRALLAAFDLPADPVDFTEGRFIDGTDARYIDVVSEIVDVTDRSVATISRSLTDGSVEVSHPALEPHDYRFLHWLFRGLLDYRVGAEGRLRYLSRYLEAPRILWLGMNRVTAVNDALRVSLELIDEPLARLISPEDRSFTLDHLIDHHGYPTDDLDSIDWEWR